MYRLFIPMFIALVFYCFLKSVDSAELVVRDDVVSGTINGHEVTFNVDTGAKTTFVSDHLAGEYCGSEFDGSGCDNAIVKIGSIRVSVRLHALGNFDSDLIVLGQDFMSAVGIITFDYGGPHDNHNLRDVYIQGTFNGHNVKFSIDTGCGRGFLSSITDWTLMERLCDGGFVSAPSSAKFANMVFPIFGYCEGTVNVLGKTIVARFEVMDIAFDEDVLLCADIFSQLGTLTFKLDSHGSARLLSASD